MWYNISMINFFKTLFSKRYPTGAISDFRPPDEQAKDWLHEEIAGSVAFPMFTKEEADKMKVFPVLNQKQTQSCVAHAVTLCKEINDNFSGSPMFIYRQRSNFAGQGMIASDAGDILTKRGICRSSLLETPTSEEEANRQYISEEMLRDAVKQNGDGFVHMVKIDYDSIASVVNTGTPVVIFIYATYREWAKEWVKIIDNPSPSIAPVRHAITILPKTGFTYKDKRYFLIQDSAWFGGKQYRYVSESFLNERCYVAFYFIRKQPKLNPKYPEYTFDRDLKVGDKGIDVMHLQEILQYEDCFDFPNPTGFFGGITRSGVKKLQDKYPVEILYPVGLTKGTGYFGKSTRNFLNGRIIN